MGINNPIPRSLKSESKKAAKILSSFIKPNQIAGPDQVIPPRILKNAKGLAIITVLKAGFLFSGRAGSGVIVARLPDGSWSAPSAIVTAGAGVGGQIGAELTDFVFVLNTKAAVDTFAQLGSVTLGTNVSIAAGPLGRSAEAAGTATVGSVSAVFAYSKTKGLFAGVSLEGSAIVERREANRKFYGSNCKARNILAGQVDIPPACEALMRVLDSRVFSNKLPYDEDDLYNDDYYDDIPDDFSDTTSDYSSASRNRRGTVSSSRSRRRGNSNGYYSSDEDQYSSEDDYGYSRNRRTSTRGTSSGGSAGGRKTANWEDDIYDTNYNNKSRSRGNSDVDRLGSRLGSTRLSPRKSDQGSSGAPSRPSVASKPNFGGAQKSNATQAIALYTFKGEQSGDLPFKKGDVIDILKKTDTIDDWWTGRNNGLTGIFPANYVELI
ncbi:LAS seventeen-binding protein 3, putative [Candida dubliniensis CD36]|uniref:LAS seventeen-binding protein 3, putative n=1 Tax=Candida dubliniensis (strain CD36 / ATCC MYA-646 / CBS 7987 / NCPF 3949 / NRRL Y-17841) TaxID=573826 RepID=B9WBF0_CANDC|nr:LAS seventeen-binding protein 3, putative [Candida dubliniensis CD36]CAX43721.1 LAS seventeen-binding protein 3, putative [Candida dubliniensis CD36]